MLFDLIIIAIVVVEHIGYCENNSKINDFKLTMF